MKRRKKTRQRQRKLKIETVVKKDGSKEAFDLAKIKRSVVMAGRDTEEYRLKEAEKIVTEVMKEFKRIFSRRRKVEVGEIRNVVEPAIAKAGYFATAKYYILYGAGKEEIEFKVREPELSRVSEMVAQRRYLKTDLEGKILETPGEMMWRVAKQAAKPDITFNGDEGSVEKTARDFYRVMVERKFSPAGRVLFEMGNEGGTGQLASCFVLKVKDSIETIFKTLGEAALIQKNNGGTGFNFSQIRPHGDKVKNVPGAASGPTDFLRAYNACMGEILQGAKRHGGNMAILNADHPDILEFVALKLADGELRNFNISVGATDKFMEAVEKGRQWSLVNPRTGEVVRKIAARRLFNEVAKNAWATGDPGMIFLDRMEKDNPTPSLGKLEATNPCGEQPLLPYESCNLGSVVLSRHVRERRGKAEIDWDDLAKTVRLGVHFLDNMIELNQYPLPEIERIVRFGNRKIGLGVMGFGHLLFKLGIAYNSEEAVRMAERLAKFIKKEAEAASLELGRQRGVFDNFDVSYFVGTAERYRNATMLTIAPTGTISLLMDCSSGIEPVFALAMKRRVFYERGKKRKGKLLVLVDSVFKQELKRLKIKNLRCKTEKRKLKTARQVSSCIRKHGLKDVRGLPRQLRKVFVTTHEIGWEWHVRIQAAWQKYCDNSVSKTVNFPKGASVSEVKKAYIKAWRLGCKGITVYRDGSKTNQVLAKSGERKGKKGKQVCPECGAQLSFSEGCVSCLVCGWSKCSI